MISLNPLFKRYLKIALIIFGVFAFISLSASISEIMKMNEMKKCIRIFNKTGSKEAFSTMKGPYGTVFYEITDSQAKNMSIELDYDDFQGERGVSLLEPCDYVMDRINMATNTIVPSALLCILIYSAAANNDERKKSTRGFVRALPFKKEKLYLYKLLAGIIIPITAVIILLLLAEAAYSVVRSDVIAAYEEKLCSGGIYAYANTINPRDIISASVKIITFYFAAMFLQTIFGSPLAGIVTAGLGCCCILGGLAVLNDVIMYHLVRNNYDSVRLLERFFSIVRDNLYHNLPVSYFQNYHIYMLAAGAVMALIGYAAAKFSKDEKSGEIFMFNFLREVSRVLAAFFGGLCFFGLMYSQDYVNKGNIWAMLLCMAAGGAAAVFVLNKIFDICEN